MTFVTAGLAIAGLAAMAIPIVIHLLFRQRRQPIVWAAMRFLLEAMKKQKRRLQLEQLLLLVARCLVLGLLGFALARPLLQANNLLDTGAARVVYLIIDNGLASSARDEDDATALKRHIDEAVSIVESLGASDAVGIVTAARPAHVVLNPPSTDHGAVVHLLGEMKPESSATDLPASLTALRGAIDARERSGDQVLVYLLSDFRAGSAALDAPLAGALNDLPESVRLFTVAPAQTPIENIQITSIDPVRSVVLPGAADGSGQVTVRLARHGGVLDASTSRVKLDTGGNTPMEPRVVNWQPGQSEASVDFLLNMSATTEQELPLAASLDHDQLPGDDERFAVLTLRDRIGVLVVDRRSFLADRTIEQLSPGQWIQRALEPVQGSPMQLVDVEPAALSRADVRTADVMLLTRPDLLDDNAWELVRDFVQHDGLVLITPPAEARVHQWINEFTKQLHLPWQFQLEVIEHDPPLYFADEQPREAMLRMISGEAAELLRPVSVMRTLPVTDTHGHGRAVLTFADGTPAILVGSPGMPAANEGEHSNGAEVTSPTASDATGMIILLTFAPQLDWTNLPTKPLMVPLFQELVRQGLSEIRAARRAVVGAQNGLGLPVAAADLALKDDRIAVTSSGNIEQPLRAAGLYTILDRARVSIGRLAVNIEPQAGRTQTQSESAVLDWLRGSGKWEYFQPEKVTASMQRSSGGSPISHLLIIAVVALLVIETLMARWFSHANRSRFGRTVGITASPESHQRGAARIVTSTGRGGS